MSSAASSTLSAGTGLVSGINYQALLQQLDQLNSQPITLVQQKIQTVDTQQTALGDVSSALATFQSSVDALSQSSSFLNITAQSSDSSVVTASADSTATPGTSTVSVLQLAQAERDASQGVATIDTTPIASGAGTLQFSVGTGAVTTINLTAGETLQQLNDAINNAAGSGVQASILNDGSPTNPYRLVLTSTATGSANAVKFVNNDSTLNFATPTIEGAYAPPTNSFNGTATSSGTYTGAASKNVLLQITTPGAIGTAKYKVSTDGGLTWSADDAFTTSTSNVDVTGGQGVNINFAAAGANPANFAVGDTVSVDVDVPQLQKAQNAIIQANGVQVQRATNTFSDVIAGVTLTANNVSATPQTITVASQTANVQSNITAFTTAYNALVDQVTTQTKYDTTTNTAAPLFGDSGVEGILSSIRSQINTSIPGLTTYPTLSSIGITFDDNGHLNVDSGALTTALQTNPTEVSKLFVQSGTSNSSAIQFVQSSTDTQPGNYQVNITQAAAQGTLEGTQTLGTGGLAAAERLTITYGASSATQVQLSAGQTLDSIIQQLNASFSTNGLPLTAQSDGGKLKITTNNYGSSETVGVFSNQDAATANQLGFGTSLQTAAGADVVGTINGLTATGSGQTLTGVAGDANGLQLLITSKTPTTATVGLTQGVGLSLDRYVTSQTDPTTGFFITRNNSYNTQITDYNNQITTLQDRVNEQDATLKAQFTDLETKLSTLQSQGDFLMGQLSSLIGSSSSSSSK